MRTLLTCMTLVLWVTAAGAASSVPGSTYYCYAFDVENGMPVQFSLQFGADNSTDNGTTAAGSLVLSNYAQGFDNATGTYLAGDLFYTLTWEGSVAAYSAYYEGTVTTYYSIFGAGGALLQGTVLVGGLSVLTTITYPLVPGRPDLEEPMEQRAVVWFVGILTAT